MKNIPPFKEKNWTLAWIASLLQIQFTVVILHELAGEQMAATVELMRKSALS